MASEGPDPLAFKTWEDAFQYPIPTIRKLEQQLRNHGEDNRHKLRNLVGVSYRELLGTAERIINMDARMQEVEVILGQAGQKCNSRAVDRIFKNHGRFQEAANARNSHRNALAAQLTILQTCPTIITRLLKRGASSLLAAKILVLSRLTHKTLSQEPEAAPLIEALRQRLTSLRRRLLSAIDKRLASPDKEMNDLIQDMCAFSLATSSTPTDVLRHFHHVRLKAIVWHLEQELDIKQHAVDAMKLLLATLRDSQLIFPKRLADALGKLKEQPLMQQPDVLSVAELNFDIHGRWVADELRNYTPWPRHDELQNPEADKLLKVWAKQALKKFGAGLKSVLAGQKDFKQVMGVRKDLLDAWPWSDTRLPGLHSADVVDELRNLLNNQLMKIIKQSVGQLLRLPVAITEALDSKEIVLGQETSLWDTSLTSMDFGNGATEFKQAILTRHHGASPLFSDIVPIFDEWTENIISIRALVKEMRDGRWDDDIAEDADDLDSRQTLLSEDDPQLLDQTLEESLDTVSRDFHSASLKIVLSIIDSNENKPQKAIFLLRLLREISQRAASQEKRLAIVVSSSTNSAEIITPLHSALAIAATNSALSQYRKFLSKSSRASILEARTLWEGHPPLPIQPSTGAFKFLRKLTKVMLAFGADLWAVGATDTLKILVVDQITSNVDETVYQVRWGIENGARTNEYDEKDEKDANNADVNVETTESETKNTDTTQVKKEVLIQMLLDIFYLQRAMGSNTLGQDLFGATIKEVIVVAGIGEKEVERISKSAGDYWKRTYLMFALLVVDG